MRVCSALPCRSSQRTVVIIKGGPSRKKSVYTRNWPPARKRAANSDITQLIVKFASLMNYPNRLSFQTALSYVKFHEYLTWFDEDMTCQATWTLNKMPYASMNFTLGCVIFEFGALFSAERPILRIDTFLPGWTFLVYYIYSLLKSIIVWLAIGGKFEFSNLKKHMNEYHMNDTAQCHKTNDILNPV